MTTNVNELNQQIEYYKQLYLKEKEKNTNLSNEIDKITKELIVVKNENQNLKNQIKNNQNNRPSFTEALNMRLQNNMGGNTNNNTNADDDLGRILVDEIRNDPNGFCNRQFFSWNCCFAKDTKLIVEKNGKTYKKNIQDIEIDDHILTLFNGEKKFTKVKYKKNYNDVYKFYEFKCFKGDKIKTITVTHNHIMIAYDKEMKKLIYKTAENIIKNEDYFNTIDGLYEVKEIKIFNMKHKYALGVDEGSIIADDILVSCLNMNDLNKNLSLNDLILKYNITIS